MFEKTAELIPGFNSVDIFRAYASQIYWKIPKRAPKRYSRRGRWRIFEGIHMKMSEKNNCKNRPKGISEKKKYHKNS